jgi:hypothetical protein
MARPKTSRSIAADIDRTFKANMKLLDESMAGLSKNCKAYLDRVMARARLQREYLDNRALRGLDPQNLGLAAAIRYDFSAVIDARPVEVDAKRQAFEDALDAEFPSIPAHERLEPELKKTKAKTKKRTK